MSTTYARSIPVGCQHWPDDPENISPGFERLKNFLREVGTKDEYGGGYVPSHLCFLSVMTEEEIIFFEYICRVSTSPITKTTPDGFALVTDYLLEEYFTEKKIRSRLASLKAKGFLEIEFHHRQRWVRVNTEALDAALQVSREKQAKDPVRNGRKRSDRICAQKGAPSKPSRPLSSSSLHFVQTTTSTHVHRPEPGPGPAVACGDVPYPDSARANPALYDKGNVPAPKAAHDSPLKEKEVHRPKGKGDVQILEERSDNMGMIPALDRPSAASNPEVTALDRQHAQQLFEALKKTQLYDPRAKPSAWALPFAKLRKTWSDSEVCEVFSWFVENIADQYTPKVRSAATFNRDFVKLKAAMLRHREKTKPVMVLNTVQTESSPAGRKVLENLEHHHWPKGSRALLPAAVEVSLKNYGKFLEKLWRYDGKDKFLRDWIRPAFSPPVDFVTEWFDRVCKNVNGWDDWSGKFNRKHVLSEDNEDFIGLVYEAAAGGGSKLKIAKFLEELK